MAAAVEQLVSEPEPPPLVHRVEAFFKPLGDAIAADVGEDRADVYAQLERVAAKHLQAFNPSAHISHADLIDYVLSAEKLCPQADLDGKFSEPPVSLYRGEHFDISALTWIDGTTSIHQHGFCGAFHVLAGSSIHSRYRFQPWQAPVFKQRAIAGQLQLQDIEVLQAGDTRIIARGDELIHALFHMIRPSVTIVIRTITDDPNTEIQYDYRWPGLAQNPFQRNPPTLRKLQYLRMLRVLDENSFDAHQTRVLGNADLYLAYTLIYEQTMVSADLAQTRRLSNLCTSLPQEQHDLVFQAAHNDLLSRTLIDLRRKLHHPEHRFLLAMLLNVFDRRELLRLVQREFHTSDPAAKIVGWVAEMTGNTDRFSNLIGLDFNTTALDMLAAMFSGLSLTQTLAQLTLRFGDTAVIEQRDALTALFHALKSCALFHQVFVDLPE
ncbi:MAG: hypothetical protein SGI99_12875 [Pseudomonadota bacterium]|nr:hypothetical protein [Pseudomonadota bacterium]